MDLDELAAEANIFWVAYFPEYKENKRFQELFIRAALVGYVFMADGDYNETEEDWLDYLYSILVKNDGDGKAFSDGLIEGICQDTSPLNESLLFTLCSQLHHRSRNLNTIKILLRAAKIDKKINEKEYMFIQKVARVLKINLPSMLDFENHLSQRESQSKKIIPKAKRKNKEKVLSNAKHKTRTQAYVGASQKKCCTCEYWTGERKLANSLGTRGVNIKGGQIKGGCLNRESDYKNSRNRFANNTCAKWRVWVVLT